MTHPFVGCGDDTCEKESTGGGAEQIIAGASYVRFWIDPALTDPCYTIQVAGWRDTLDLVPGCDDGCQGSGAFEITCVRDQCPDTNPPTPDYCPVPPDIGFGTKNRYMTFVMDDPGPPYPVQDVAMRVKFVSIPGHEYAEGRTMWVQEPFPVTESAGSDQPTPRPIFWAAELGCEPFYTDWSVYDRVDVYNDVIIPDAVFEVQALRDDPSCSEKDEEDYSPELTVVMSACGDVVGHCSALPCASEQGGADCCSAPQGVVDFVDVSAVIDKFRNLPCTPRKARADVINSTVTMPPPDRKVDFVDCSCVVDAFRGDPCPLPGPPLIDPCD